MKPRIDTARLRRDGYTTGARTACPQEIAPTADEPSAPLRRTAAVPSRSNSVSPRTPELVSAVLPPGPAAAQESRAPKKFRTFPRNLSPKSFRKELV
jgi:hypothetical protein